MILRSILFILALANAGGRRLFRLGLPRVPNQPGWKQRLALATVVTMTTLLVSCGKKPQRHEVMCYSRPAIQPANSTLRFSDSLRTIWTSLDPQQSATFVLALNGMVKAGKLPPDSAKSLTTVYQELLAHHARSNSGATCYMMTSAGMTAMTTRQAVYQQIICLRTAKQKGTLDDATIAKIATTLAGSIEVLEKSKTLPESDYKQWQTLEKSLKDGTLVPSAEATATANLILELEAITPPVPKPPTPATNPEPGKQEAL